MNSLCLKRELEKDMMGKYVLYYTLHKFRFNNFNNLNDSTFSRCISETIAILFKVSECSQLGMLGFLNFKLSGGQTFQVIMAGMFYQSKRQLRLIQEVGENMYAEYTEEIGPYRIGTLRPKNSF